MVEQGRADKIAFFMPLQLEAATVDDKLAAFIGAFLDPAFNLRLMLRGDDRAQFFLKGTHRPSMGQALRRALEAHPDLARRATLDVDPLTML